MRQQADEDNVVAAIVSTATSDPYLLAARQYTRKFGAIAIALAFAAALAGVCFVVHPRGLTLELKWAVRSWFGSTLQFGYSVLDTTLCLWLAAYGLRVRRNAAAASIPTLQLFVRRARILAGIIAWFSLIPTTIAMIGSNSVLLPAAVVASLAGGSVVLVVALRTRTRLGFLQAAADARRTSAFEVILAAPRPVLPAAISAGDAAPSATSRQAMPVQDRVSAGSVELASTIRNDWETIVFVLIGIAVFGGLLHVARSLPAYVEYSSRSYWDQLLTLAMNGSASPPGPTGLSVPFPSYPKNPPPGWIPLVGSIGDAFVGICSVVLVIWGLLTFTIGLRLRRLLVWSALIMVLTTIGWFCIVQSVQEDDWIGRTDSLLHSLFYRVPYQHWEVSLAQPLVDASRGVLMECAVPLLLLLIVTRSEGRQLFDRQF